MTIDQTTFEIHVPSFKNATDEVFNKLKPLLDRMEEELLTDLVDTGQLPEDAAVAECFLHLVCLAAAHRAVSHLDLVLTPTGFGIVSNQNLAPASRDRVAALTRQLYRERSDCEDRLLDLLTATSWSGSEAAIQRICRLLWNATLARRYGVRSQSSFSELYVDEYQALVSQIDEAEQKVSELISPELHEELLVKIRTHAVLTAEETFVLAQSRSLIAVQVNP